MADRLLAKVLDREPRSIAGWALRGVAWRMLGDGRTDWLHGAETLACLLPLHDAEHLLPRLNLFLHELHDASPFPLGQSLRGGTQTRGNLFDRGEPILHELQAAIMATISDYQTALPPSDPSHPLLRTRDEQWDMMGSWSVRLSGGGDFHTSHIHPQGTVSSALYLELPNDKGDDPQAGWLELGRPPTDLHLDLEPLRVIEPKVGHLALFPSTLYHGTRPFHGDRRMTVAFDVNLRQSPSL